MREIVHNNSIAIVTGAGPLAGENHAEFEKLCALVTSGELTDDEWGRLSAHLEYCELCQHALKEHLSIDAEIMPAVAAMTDAGTERPFDLERGERRLMEGLQSMETEAGRKRREMIRKLIGVISAVLAASGLLFFLHLSTRSQHEHSVAQPGKAAPVSIFAPQGVATPAPPVVDDRLALDRALSTIASLERQLRHASDLRVQSQGEALALTQQLEGQQQSNRALVDQKEQLTQQIAAAQAEVSSLRDKAGSASSTSIMQVAELQHQVQFLTAELHERESNLAERTELLSHDRDIRDLIGARNLLITEIYDVTQTGARAKAFGRIFYTKGKSLVFYGYDLDQRPGLNRDAAFQAWGSNGSGRDVSLGLFYQDDSKKRWILKFDDAKVLAHLNSIFVTVEPEGGSSKPTGKQLLTASLQIPPNHP